jgi:PPM family protein phosphatase
VGQSIRDLRWPAIPTASTASTLVVSAGSDTGAKRSVNEDAFLAAPPLFMVADGMGGHDRGDVAAQLVVDEFETLAGDQEVTASRIAEAIARSRDRIRALATADSAPGSTLVVAAYVTLAGVEYWLIAHEGDARAYLWTREGLEQLTRDHSIVQELVDAGQLDPDAVADHPQRHVVTRALGGKADTEAEFTLVPAVPGGRLLLCSDGLSSELSQRSIGHILGRHERTSECVDALLEAAVRAGGRDNVTAVIVDVVAEAADRFEDTLDSLAVVSADTLERLGAGHD